MAKIIKIGIVGCGAIGSSLAKTIAKTFFAQAKLVALFDLNFDKTKELIRVIKSSKQLIAGSLDDLIDKSDLVIEAASGAASWDIARRTLSKKRSIMIMSVGGIVGHYPELLNLAISRNVKVYIPSGAISGVDALKASAFSGIKEVVLTTSKNPVSFQGVNYIKEKKIKLEQIKTATVLFSGSAQEAVKHFPQNINVAAILSLAGIGAKKTLVRIIADPKTKSNIHEVKIVSRAGSVYTRTENVLHPDNPKTSYLAFLSAVAVLKQILEPVKIGT